MPQLSNRPQLKSLARAYLALKAEKCGVGDIITAFGNLDSIGELQKSHVDDLGCVRRLSRGEGEGGCIRLVS